MWLRGVGTRGFRSTFSGRVFRTPHCRTGSAFGYVRLELSRVLRLDARRTGVFAIVTVAVFHIVEVTTNEQITVATTNVAQRHWRGVRC